MLYFIQSLPCLMREEIRFNRPSAPEDNVIQAKTGDAAGAALLLRRVGSQEADARRVLPRKDEQ